MGFTRAERPIDLQRSRPTALTRAQFGSGREARQQLQ